MRIPFSAKLLVFALAGTAGAQTPDHLVGLTRLVPTLNHHDHNNCRLLGRCPPAGFPPAPAQPFAGGTAWDPIRSGAWISNGFVWAQVDDNCNYICPPMAVPLPSPNTVVTGLDVAESMRQIWVTDSNNVVHQFRLGCPPLLVQSCATGIATSPNAALTGVAVDEGCRIVFYTHTDFATGVTRLLAAPVAAPCQIFFNQILPRCPTPPVLGPATGLAVDWCRRLLYVTDGFHTEAIRYQCTTSPLAVTILGTNCCFPTVVGNDPMIGLAVRPGRETTFGRSCANGICATCPMALSLLNDPNLGNGSFALTLQGPPLQSLVWCIIGAGPCTPPGILVPPLCGPIFTPVILGTIGPLVTPAGVGCGPSLTFPLALPVIPGLCGSVISAQCVALCTTPTAPVIGTSVGNCITFVLQGS